MEHGKAGGQVVSHRRGLGQALGGAVGKISRHGAIPVFPLGRLDNGKQPHHKQYALRPACGGQLRYVLLQRGKQVCQDLRSGAGDNRAVLPPLHRFGRKVFHDKA